jgi:hypothetical protein
MSHPASVARREGEFERTFGNYSVDSDHQGVGFLLGAGGTMHGQNGVATHQALMHTGDASSHYPDNVAMSEGSYVHKFGHYGCGSLPPHCLYTYNHHNHYRFPVQGVPQCQYLFPIFVLGEIMLRKVT